MRENYEKLKKAVQKRLSRLPKCEDSYVVDYWDAELDIRRWKMLWGMGQAHS